MLKVPTVLVLGAGASKNYGFPLGSELRQTILGLAHENNPISVRSGLHTHPLLSEFVRSFRDSQLASIDNFLGLNLRYSQVGKLAIAAVLLQSEVTSNNYLSESMGLDWYSYLWNRLALSGRWSDLDFRNLSIITFNYDRSFEVVLLRAMKATYGISSEVASKKLQELKILHVYGDIGSPWQLDERYSEFGRPLTSDQVLQSAEWLKVIPEARDDDPVFKEAQELLLKAQTICFLGFGFDRLNLRRLNASFTCRNRIDSAQGVPQNYRDIRASCMGRTAAEVRSDAHAIGLNFSQMEVIDGLPPGFVSQDCLGTLRNTLVLGAD